MEKTTAKELTKRIMAEFEDIDPYGLTYTENIDAAIDCYEYLVTDDKKEIQNLINCFETEIQERNGENSDDLRDLIADIRKAAGIIEPKLTDEMIREWFKGKGLPDEHIIDIHIYRETKQANIISMIRNEYGAILWETVITRDDEDIKEHSRGIMTAD